MDYETEYNNRARVPDYPEITAGWDAQSTQTREKWAGSAELDVAYSPDSPRTTMDIFWPEGATETTPVAMFIHGGYWRAFDGKSFSFLAEGALANGVAMAIPTYDLCPNVPLSEIISQMQRAALFLHKRLGRRFAVTGHSAGGHLTAALASTDWAALDPSAPADLVRFAMPISGLFELESFIGTTINEALRLDEAEAKRLSPLYQTPPAGAEIDIYVGGTESDAYHRQSRDLNDRWGKAATTRLHMPDGANHFTVIGPLADPQSEMTTRLVGLARAAQAF